MQNPIYDPQRGFSNRSREKIGIVKGILPIFDSRTAWSDCAVIGQIHDQGACGSCLALGAAEMFSGRVCIATNAIINTMYSAEDFMLRLTVPAVMVDSLLLPWTTSLPLASQPLDSMVTIYDL